MSITSEQYIHWCNAVTNCNQAVVEIIDHRRSNYEWMEKLLREFFNQMGEVVNIHFKSDAREISVRMADEVTLDSDLLNSLPFNFKIIEDIGDIVFVLTPQISTVDELTEEYKD